MTTTDKEPLLTTQLRPCSACGIDTYWRVKGQSTKGTCPDHSSAWRAGGALNSAELSGLRSLVRDAFGQVDVIHELPHPEYPPDGFVELVELTARYRFLVNPDRFGRANGPDSFTTTHRFIAPHRDAGPCAGCGGTVRRYGELANPLCSTCRKER